MQNTAKATRPTTTKTQAIDFPAGSILASATDLRGVIRYANPSFCDVAQYPLAELVGAPHNIIRHPDMPRGVFHLYWQRLKAGLPVCAYVKNRASDGRFYWVFATATHLPDGYLSVRIKPKADVFAVTRELYDDLLMEEAAGMAPEQSAERLCTCLKEQGFPTFGSYMRAALAAEFALRSDADQMTDSALQCIDRLANPIERAETLIRNISDVFDQVRGEPVNLRILAGRMEGAGAAIGTISKNYDMMAADMYQLVERLGDPETGILVRMRKAVDHGRMSAQIAALMQTAVRQLAGHAGQSGAEEVDHSLLTNQSESLNDSSRAVLAEIAALGQTIPESCRQLRRRINGLDLVKLLCRVESGRMGDVDSGLNGIIKRLDEAHHKTDRYLSDLSAMAFQINSQSRGL